jgi:hypothetical protein
MADQSPAPVADRDWTVDVTGRIESVVETIRDKTTVPVTKGARAVVFGLVAGALGVVALFLMVLALIRVLDVYLPIHPLSRRVWIIDAGAAAIFLGSGAFLWRTRQPRGTEA